MSLVNHTVFVNVVKIDAIKATLKRAYRKFCLYFLQIFSSFEKPLVQGVSSKICSVIVSCMKIGAGKATLYLIE